MILFLPIKQNFFSHLRGWPFNYMAGNSYAMSVCSNLLTCLTFKLAFIFWTHALWGSYEPGPPSVLNSVCIPIFYYSIFLRISLLDAFLYFVWSWETRSTQNWWSQNFRKNSWLRESRSERPSTVWFVCSSVTTALFSGLVH